MIQDLKIKYFDEEIDIYNEHNIINKKTNTIMLDKIPSERGIYVKYKNKEFVEVQNNPSQYEFVADRETSTLLFNPIMAGKEVEIDYSAIGKFCMSADKVYTNIDDNGDVIQTLDELLVENHKILESVKTVGDGATVITQLQANIDSVVGLTGSIAEGSTVNDKLIKTTNNAKATDITLNNSVANANSKLNDLNAWVDNHGNIVDLDNRVESVETSIPQINSQLEQMTIQKIRKTLKNDNWFGWKTINFIGDSITHGANCADISNDAWAYIMKKFLQEEYNTQNFGYATSYASIENGAYKTVLDITEIGNWNKSADGEHLGMYSYSSSDSGAKLIITIKKPTKKLKVMFDKVSNGGILNVKLDGVTKFTINTNGISTKNLYSSTLDLSAKMCPYIIEIEKTDANITTICGLQLFNDETQLMINNFGRSGARLTDISDNLLNIMCDTNVCFFSMGHNDRFFSDDGTFTQKINTAITKFKTVGAYVIVLDFIWDLSIKNNIYKQELSRLAKECNGVYINFNELLPYGNNINDWIASGFLSDTSHPTPAGHKIIAEIVASKIKLGVSSKTLVEKLQKNYNANDWIYVEDSDLSSPYTNTFTDNKYKTKYRKNGDILEIVLFIDANGADYTTKIFTLPSGYRPFINSTYYLNLGTSATINAIQINESGDVIWTPSDKTKFTKIYGSVIIPCFS